MGNTESVVASGVKKQAEGVSRDVYNFLNIKGSGELVAMMKEASKSKDYSQVDDFIKNKLVNYLYNEGRGRLIPVDHIITLRNQDRSMRKLLDVNKRIMDENGEFPPIPVPDEDPSITIDNYDKKKHRFCCFKLEETGTVGEGILLICMLNASALHNELAKRLLHFYPRLINDIYLFDEYCGENVLHIAIVNEDPGMVKYLLNKGVDVNERCFGNFMCPEDQKSSRYDILGNEEVQVTPNTNYKGYVYWGEYPLSFAACLGQEECYRLILSRGADPDAQDTNGNTTIHMLVIYEKIAMFDLVYECGAQIDIVNRLGMTPLTLAAKLARREIFAHILKVQSEIYWQIGHITCAAHPLTGLDSIDIKTGKIDKNSALNLIAFGENPNHLDMLEGVVVDLLVAKWNAYVKNRFKKMMFLFSVYFILTLTCFLLRPGPCIVESPTATTVVPSGPDTTTLSPSSPPGNATDLFWSDWNYTSKYGTTSLPSMRPPATTEEASSDFATSDVTEPPRALQLRASPIEGGNSTIDPSVINNSTNSSSPAPPVDKTTANSCTCRLMEYNTMKDAVRWALEILMFFCTLLYILQAIHEACFLGVKVFLESLSTVPSRVIFLFSCLLKLAMPVLRVACWQGAEDMIAVVVMLGTAPYFLFFCRGYKSVGPFVTMIYKMIVGDLLRFVTIYTVFVMGFSQAYFIIYRSYQHPDGGSNPMETPMQSIMFMFLASLNSFGDLYNNLKYTRQQLVGQILFLLYMICVTILLINMLIAMMGNTYQRIAELKNEWMRQWARIVLVVERGVSPSHRLAHLNLYSKPMADGTPALILRTQGSEDEIELLKEITEMKIRNGRNRKKRQQQLLGSQAQLAAGSSTSVRVV